MLKFVLAAFCAVVKNRIMHEHLDEEGACTPHIPGKSGLAVAMLIASIGVAAVQSDTLPILANTPDLILTRLRSVIAIARPLATLELAVGWFRNRPAVFRRSGHRIRLTPRAAAKPCRLSGIRTFLGRQWRQSADAAQLFSHLVCKNIRVTSAKQKSFSWHTSKMMTETVSR